MESAAFILLLSVSFLITTVLRKNQPYEAIRSKAKGLRGHNAGANKFRSEASEMIKSK